MEKNRFTRNHLKIKFPATKFGCHLIVFIELNYIVFYCIKYNIVLNKIIFNLVLNLTNFYIFYILHLKLIL